MLENRDGGGLRFINEQCLEYLPLRYPILYPHGELGWRHNYPLIDYPWVVNGNAITASASAGAAAAMARDDVPKEEDYSSGGEEGREEGGGATGTC